MSLALIIDTAFETCQVGLVWDGQFIAQDKAASGGSHDRVLTGMVKRIFDDNKVATKDIDKIIVTTGPGRFTGLRVGIAFARGLALVHKTPLVGVNTADAIAREMIEKYPDEENLAVLIAVKRGESFVQFIKPELSALHVVLDDQLACVLKEKGNPLVGGILSPAALAMNLRLSAVAEPGLSAILELGLKTAENQVVRPYYAA